MSISPKCFSCFSPIFLWFARCRSGMKVYILSSFDSEGTIWENFTLLLLFLRINDLMRLYTSLITWVMSLVFFGMVTFWGGADCMTRLCFTSKAFWRASTRSYIETFLFLGCGILGMSVGLS